MGMERRGARRTFVIGAMLAAIALTLAIGVAWRVTGGDYYTKSEVIGNVSGPADASDPLTAAGFYDNATAGRTVRIKEFHLGLLPTPAKLLDKNSLSVTTILPPVWIVTLLLIWRNWRKSNRPVRVGASR